MVIANNNSWRVIVKFRVGRRNIKLKNAEIETPSIVLSYSSRACPPDPLQNFLEETLNSIDNPILLSAYDLFHRSGLEITYDIFSKVDDSPTSVVMLDSGGYEVIWNNNAMRAGIISLDSRGKWSEEIYNALLAEWEADTEIIAVTYDAVAPMYRQIERANKMTESFPKITIDFLLKPTKENTLLKISDITPFIKDFASFPLIGVTEKEMGVSMRDRLKFLIELRDCLTKENMNTPIHVFGGLEPLMTPLYFMAGADVFDGLSWLRYAFTSTGSQYEQGHLSVEYPGDNLQNASRRQKKINIDIIIELEKSMRLLIDNGSINDAFGESGSHIERVWDEVWKK